jgi:hypothetical protein
MILRVTGQRSSTCLVGVVLLLAVFSLPFHSHAHIAAVQVKAECSCIVHRTRFELCSPESVFALNAVFAEFPLLVSEPSLLSRDVFGSESIRAPPSF